MRKQSDETGTTSTTVGASFMNWRGDVALGGNAQTQFNVGKDTQLTARANLNRSAFIACLPPTCCADAAPPCSRGAGQLTLRASTNERLQLAAMGVVPVLCSILGRLRARDE